MIEREQLKKEFEGTMSVARPVATTKGKSGKESEAEGCQEEVSTCSWLEIRRELKERTPRVLVKIKLSVNVSDYRVCQIVRGRGIKSVSASLLLSSRDRLKAPAVLPIINKPLQKLSYS